MKVLKLEEFKRLATERFGSEAHKWKFVCPRCKTAQSAEDFVDAGVGIGHVGDYIGFSCIGIFEKEKGCDWTLGGLLQLHDLEIETEDGKLHKHFDLAEAV